MRKLGRTRVAALVALGSLLISAAPAMAAGGAQAGTPAATEQLAHMGQGAMPTQQNCPTGMMGHGMIGQRMMPGQGMMGQGMPGQGMMGQGMMGQGMTGQGMTGQGMTGQGMMGGGMMGQGMMGQGPMGPEMTGPRAGARIEPSRDLTSKDVRHYLEHSLQREGNKRLKVGEVQDQDDDKIVAEIVTQDGALVDKFAVDRHSGIMERIY